MFHLHKGKNKHKHTEPAGHVTAPVKPAGGDGPADSGRGARDQNPPALLAGASHPAAGQYPTVHAVAATPSDLTLDGDDGAQTTGTAREGDRHTTLAPGTPLPTTPLPADKGRTALTPGVLPPARTIGDEAGERAAAPLDMGLFLDEEALLAASTFPIRPAELVELAKGILAKGVHKCQDQLAEDFAFSAPFIGPLDKQGFASTMEYLDLESAFPDMQARIYHVRVDPLEPHRVWLTNRPVGRHLGYLRARAPAPLPPTGKLVELPPQTSSLTFDEQGKVTSFTMGYIMDRRVGNSGGLGGAFGLLWAIGAAFPYPEGRPWEASWQQRLFNASSPWAKAAAFLIDCLSSALLPSWFTVSHSRNTG